MNCFVTCLLPLSSLLSCLGNQKAKANTKNDGIQTGSKLLARRALPEIIGKMNGVSLVKI